MMWLKAFHIIGVVSWFAGLLYLPRLFVYHAQIQQGVVDDPAGNARFKIMERKLFMIMTIGAVIAAKPTERRLLLEEAAGVAGLHGRVCVAAALPAGSRRPSRAP